MNLPNRQQAVADAIAGVSIAGLLLPEAVAYSGIANLPPAKSEPLKNGGTPEGEIPKGLFGFYKLLQCLHKGLCKHS